VEEGSVAAVREVEVGVGVEGLALAAASAAVGSVAEVS
jgi:hypothetical protein